MHLENHSSKSSPLLTFPFYNTSCVSLISFFNIFSNTLLPVSSGYVHPRPITAVNHKVEQCWRRFCHIFAFVSQPDPHSGGWEIQGMSDIFLIILTTEESICRGMFLTGFWGVRPQGWMWVYPHVCISKWWIKVDFYSCDDLTISPLKWGRTLLHTCMWEKRRVCLDGVIISLSNLERKKIQCVCVRISWCGSKYMQSVRWGVWTFSVYCVCMNPSKKYMGECVCVCVHMLLC